MEVKLFNILRKTSVLNILNSISHFKNAIFPSLDIISDVLNKTILKFRLDLHLKIEEIHISKKHKFKFHFRRVNKINLRYSTANNSSYFKRQTTN